MPMTRSQRQRLYRKRRATGARVVAVEVDAGFVEMLIDAGYLQAWDADSAEKVRQAVGRLHDRLKVMDA